MNSISYLNYSKAKLKNLPKEILDKKDTLVALDISGNTFDNFYFVLDELKNFKKLKKLKINIYTQEQAKQVIDSMPNLEYLNDEVISDNEEEDEIIINNNKKNVKKIPLIKINDDNFKIIFKKFFEFFKFNNKLNQFNKIVEIFNNKCEELNIKENKIKTEKLSNEEIKKELELYELIVEQITKIKEDVDNNKYHTNSKDKLIYIMKENENIKNRIYQILNSRNQKHQNSNKKENESNSVTKNIKNNEVELFNERSFTKSDEKIKSINSSIHSDKKIKKYFKQEDLIKFYDDPKFSNLLIKNKTEFDALNIFDDENNEIISREKINTRTLNLNNLLEIINQIYKIRYNRIEKQQQGVYNKGTLEQDLYNYLKSKYGLKKLIIEWSINILSSIRTYYKINCEVYLFALILKNELDEESIEILNKIKKAVNNILNLVYDYNIKKIENIKSNKEFMNENEWKAISNCLYSDDEILRDKFMNKITNYIYKLVKGKDLLEKVGEKILYEDFMNNLIIFNLDLRKKYLNNLFILFTKEDIKRTGIINIDSFKNIIKSIELIEDEETLDEIIDELIEIADKEGSGQITFNDLVQCLDNVDIITDEGKIKILDKISILNL